MPGIERPLPATKTCGSCKQAFPRELFSRASKSWDKLHWCCKPCDRLRGQKYYREKKGPDYVRKKSAEWKAANPYRSKGYKLKHSFGFGFDHYKLMLEHQNNACAICGVTREPPEWLQVDHDHQSGVVRGLLCGHCNKGLGFFRDNPTSLAKAISYLQDNFSTKTASLISEEGKA